MKKAGIIPVLLLTAAVSLAVMTVYELTKQLLWPEVSLWGSHLITIIGVSILITGVVFVAIRDRQKRLAKVVQTMQQRAELERRLRKAEAKKDLVLNSISEVVTYQDTDKRIVWANQAAADLLKKPVDEILGMTCQQLFHHNEKQCSTCPSYLALKNGRAEEGEIRQKDGSTWLIRAHVVRNGGEEIKGVVTVASNVTALQSAQEQRRQLEIKMLQAQKLESLGILAGGIAHDFNNLLVGILGNADLALIELEKGTSPRMTIENIKQSSRRAADLTNQMLAYSGKGSFIVKPLDLNHLILNMNRLLNLSLNPHTKIRFDLGDNLPDVVGDEMQLRQVVMNLIVNAAEAIGDQAGEISVQTTVESASREQLNAPYVGETLSPGTYLVLEVTDTGCGMDEETREKLFDPFFTTKFHGRGLGLAAVQGIVRGHGGAIYVSSQAGIGSTFRILLPFETTPETVRPKMTQLS